ncbi:MAG: toast rack family protein [Anaerolineae bacterium]
MNNRSTRLTLLLIIVAALFISLGCTVGNFSSIDTVTVGELNKETQTVEVGDAEEVRVYIKMGTGELKVNRGADTLMRANFTYNVADWKPQVDYTVTDGSGRLNIRQPNSDQISIRSDIRYTWDLKFDEETPLDMRVECGAGSGDINLSKLNVTRFDGKLSAGDFTIDLSGNQSLEYLELDVGAGDATVDLNGDWEHDVEAYIQGGIGNTVLRLPKDIGVRVIVNKAIGSVDAQGLTRDGDVYVNDAYGVSPVTVEINVQTGVGETSLEVVE